MVRNNRSLRPIHHEEGKWLIFCKQFNSFIWLLFWCLLNMTVQYFDEAFSVFSKPARRNAFLIQIRSQCDRYTSFRFPNGSITLTSVRLIPSSRYDRKWCMREIYMKVTEKVERYDTWWIFHKNNARKAFELGRPHTNTTYGWVPERRYFVAIYVYATIIFTTIFFVAVHRNLRLFCR